MKKKYVFYYHFKKNYVWLGLNILAIAMLISCVWHMPALIIWWQVQTLFGLFAVTLLMWCYKYLMRHKLAEFSDEGIKIDHCQILRWQDVLAIENRRVKCCGKELPVISIIPRKDINYAYNPLQERCQKIGFGAFSLPLYDVKKTDIEKMYRLLNEYVTKD